MGLHTDWTYARTTTAVRDGKGLVEVQVAHVRTNVTGGGQSHLRIHIGTVHVDLAAMGMNDRRCVFHSGLVHPMRRRIGNHQTAQGVRIRFRLRTQVVEIDVAFLVTRHDDHVHSGHHRGSRVGAVGRRRNQGRFAVEIPIGMVVGTNH